MSKRKVQPPNPDKERVISDKKRDEAWKQIRSAARDHGVELTEKNWRNLGKGNKRRA